MVTEIWVKIGNAGNDLLPDGTKPLPEPGMSNIHPCLNQCRLLISKVLWHSHESNFTTTTHANILYNEFENYTLKIITTPPKANELNAY